MACLKSTFIVALLSLNVACATASPMRRASVSPQGMIETQADSSTELTNMFPDQPEAMAVTKSLLALAKEGTPYDDLLTIVRDLKSKIEPWHATSTDTLATSIEGVKECAVSMEGGMQQTQTKKSECTAKSTSHISHRTEESTRFTTKEHWKAQTAEKKEIMDTECKIYSDVKSETRSATARYGGGDEESYLESVSQEFCEGLLPRYNHAKEKCTTAEADHASDKGKWETAKTAYNVQVDAGNTVQTALDVNCCQYALSTKEVCEDFDSCYEDKVAEYNSVKAVIESEEKLRKVEWRVYSRIECLLPVLGTDNAAKIEECRNEEHSTTHLDIAYPEIPAKASCSIEAAYPGTDAYKNAHYGSLPDDAKGEAVAVCVGMNSEALAVAQHVPQQSASDFCAAQCKAAGFCCNDWRKGSNQMISCAQACMMRAKGSQTSEMTAANNGICKRNGQSGCNLKVNGVTYGFCSSCSDLTPDSKCNWGVGSSEACDFGAALSPPLE